MSGSLLRLAGVEGYSVPMVRQYWVSCAKSVETCRDVQLFAVFCEQLACFCL